MWAKRVCQKKMQRNLLLSLKASTKFPHHQFFSIASPRLQTEKSKIIIFPVGNFIYWVRSILQLLLLCSTYLNLYRVQLCIYILQSAYVNNNIYLLHITLQSMILLSAIRGKLVFHLTSHLVRQPKSWSVWFQWKASNH